MNFLAHLYLSGSSNKIRIGNFIGDFVKGKQLEAYDPEIAYGIMLHREIDYQTDAHPQVMKSKIRLRPKYRHYAPVIVDMFYDHFLAVHWHEFSEIKLEDFAADTYLLMEKNKDILPEKAAYMLPFMKTHNWLVNYQYLEGISRSLQGMARRTSFKSGMEEATGELRRYYSDFEREFLTFFPEMIVYCQDWISEKTA